MNENQVKFLEEYEAWKIEERLSRQYNDTPNDYIKHLQNLKNQAIIIRALNFIETYEKGTPWSEELVQSLASILRDEEK